MDLQRRAATVTRRRIRRHARMDAASQHRTSSSHAFRATITSPKSSGYGTVLSMRPGPICIAVGLSQVYCGATQGSTAETTSSDDTADAVPEEPDGIDIDAQSTTCEPSSGLGADCHIEATYDCDHARPEDPYSTRCWVLQLGPLDLSRRIVSDLATDGKTIYFVSRRDAVSGGQSAFEMLAHAVSEEGKELWRVNVGDFGWPLPPVVGDDGDVTFVASRHDEATAQFRSAQALRITPSGVVRWSVDLATRIEDDTSYGEFGVRSRAAALDSAGNLYFVAGSYLISLDAIGNVRWRKYAARRGVLGCSLAATWSPFVFGERVMLVNGYGTLYTSESSGTSSSETSMPWCQEVGTVFPDKSGSIVIPGRSNTLVVSEKGEVLQDWQFGSIYSAGVIDNLGRTILPLRKVYALDGANIEWETDDMVDVPVGGTLVDRHNRLLSILWSGVRIIDGNDGAVLMREYKLGGVNEGDALEERAAVLLASGRVVWAGYGGIAGFPDQVFSFVASLNLPIAEPPSIGWFGRHGNFRNQRRWTR